MCSRLIHPGNMNLFKIVKELDSRNNCVHRDSMSPYSRDIEEFVCYMSSDSRDLEEYTCRHYASSASRNLEEYVHRDYKNSDLTNLEEYLHRDSMSSLSIYHRVCIITEICKQLMKLHASEDQLAVHGDLVPENILLSSDFKCKLTGVSKGRLQEQDVGNTILIEKIFPNGTVSYLDPEYLITGELTQFSDVYSFGVIVLRLLTGRSPLGLVNDMNEALERDGLKEMLDESAGKWPLKEVEQLAKIALKCCEILGENRPDLTEVLNVLQSMERALYRCYFSFWRNILFSENVDPPSYFICPIVQDVMTDPVIAADGFTYECEAIKKWFEDGHTTSPMTNLKLPNSNLIPNHALLSAIKEWNMDRNNMAES